MPPKINGLNLAELVTEEVTKTLQAQNNEMSDIKNIVQAELDTAHELLLDALARISCLEKEIKKFRPTKFSHGNNGSVSSFESAMSGLQLSPDSNFQTKEPTTNNEEEVQPANNNNIEDDDRASMSDKVNLPNVQNVLLVSKQK